MQSLRVPAIADVRLMRNSVSKLANGGPYQCPKEISLAVRLISLLSVAVPVSGQPRVAQHLTLQLRQNA